MDEKINEAINTIVNAIRPNTTKSEDALRFSQAALNLAHAKAVLEGVKTHKPKGAGA